MRDIHYEILYAVPLTDIVGLMSVNKEFLSIIYELLPLKLRISGVFSYLKKNTIFPKVKNNKRINVFLKKYRNREDEPLILF